MSKPNMADALAKAARRGGESSVPPITESPPKASEAAGPSRRGKKQVAGHFDPAVSRQLRQLALERDSNGLELLREALNDLFVKHGKPPIA